MPRVTNEATYEAQGEEMVSLSLDDGGPAVEMPMAVYEALMTDARADLDRLGASVRAYRQPEGAQPQADTVATDRNDPGGPGKDAQQGNP